MISFPLTPAILIGLAAEVAFFKMQSGVVILKKKGSNKFRKPLVNQNQIGFFTVRIL